MAPDVHLIQVTNCDVFVRLSLLKVWGLIFQTVSYSIDLVYCHTFKQKQQNQPRLILRMPEAL